MFIINTLFSCYDTLAYTITFCHAYNSSQISYITVIHVNNTIFISHTCIFVNVMSCHSCIIYRNGNTLFWSTVLL